MTMKLPYQPIGRSYRNGFWSGACVGGALALSAMDLNLWPCSAALFVCAFVLDCRAAAWELAVSDGKM
jgi:uncharacterized membrane protein YoaK (UPF0700 family)